MVERDGNVQPVTIPVTVSSIAKPTLLYPVSVLKLQTFEKVIHNKLLPEPGADEYPFIGSLDPYGDTTFNGLQMRRFLSEWAVVSQRATTAEEQALVGNVEALARRCRDEIHVYLKFIGD